VELRELNPWDVSPAAARVIQSDLSARVIRSGDPTGVRFVAGIDVSVRDTASRAAVVVDTYPELEPVEVRKGEQPATFPYVPGLLSFREMPSIVAALLEVEVKPDLVVVDGQGIAHPRGLGLASHVGLVLDLPTIGCAKSLLVGRCSEPGPAVGDRSPIEYQGQVVGAAVRTRRNVTPVYVSVGHRIGLDPAVSWILALTRGYRLPEPQRQAHREAKLSMV
jgi:deoxyribonuclease V